MDFEILEKTRAFVARVRDFIEREALPLEPLFLSEGFEAIAAPLEAARARAREAGLFAPTLPPELGGTSLPLLDFAHVSEAAGRSPLGHILLNCQAPDAGNMELLLHHGSDAHRERFLRPLARGAARSCFAMTEPDRPGSNPTWLDTRAVADAAGYVIDGRKWFTSSADGAAFAIVMAVTAPDAPPHARASMIIVPLDTPGFRLVRRIPVMGHEGSGWMTHCEVAFSGCRVPLENRVGADGAGFTLAQERLGPGRIHHCMRWIGVCERAFDLLVHRAATRELAPGELLGTRGAVKEWIAESRAEIDAARLLVLEAAWIMDARGAKAAREKIAAIKFLVAGTMQRVLDRAIQAHGAMGLTDATPLAFWWAHERAARIYDGPDEVHKASLAKRILRAHGAKIE